MAQNPGKSIVIHDGTFEVPIWVEDGVEGLTQNSIGMSSIFAAGGGPQRYGEGEPLFASLEQRDWSGGRGNEFFSNDPTRYLDSLNCWTLTPDKLIPAPQWFFGKGHRPNGSDTSLPGNVDWRSLFDNTRYISRSYVPGANITADKAYFWIRRRGNPGTLTLELCSNSSGNPGTVLKTATVTTTNVTDVISVLQAFDWSSTEALTGSTTYHLKLYGASTDNAANHWEVAVDVTGGSSKTSTNDSTWTTASFSTYYRVVGADIQVGWKFFYLKQALYAVSLYRDGATSSRLWMNGARGVATSGASTTLTNTNASFGTSSEYVGALVKIIAGTGKGQVRTISSHTGTVLTVSEAWLTNPASGSEYIIYLSNRWTEITSTGLGIVQTVAVYNDIAHFGHVGSGDPIRKIRFNAGASPPAHEFADDSTNEANVLAKGYVAGTGVVLWRAVGNSVSRGTAVAWGSSHTFGTAFSAGSSDYPVNAMTEFTSGANSRMYVLKSNEIGFIDSDKWYRLNIALDSFPEMTNGATALVNGLYLYFPFLWSLQRLYGEALDDLNPNREAGIPEGRQGNIGGMANHPIGPIVGIDANTGTSASMFFDGINYHEIFRAWEAGKRISDLIWQPNEGGKRWLWIAVGDDLVYLEMPRFHQNPFADSTQKYMSEMVLTTAIYDMGNASIYKFWKDITVITKNLDGSGIFCDVDYQANTNIDTSTWEYLGRVGKSPSESLPIYLGELHQIRFRLRLQTNIATTPPVVNAIVVSGVGQLPYKWALSFRGHFGPVAKQLGGSDTRKSLNVMSESMRKARPWTILSSHYTELKGSRVLLQLQNIRPAYNIDGANTDVYADVTLMCLEDEIWRDK